MGQGIFTRRGFHLGVMFHRAAARRGPVPVLLDRPLDVAPDSGVTHTYRTLVGVIDELTTRLAAAGVRPGEHVAVYKTDNFDIALLTCALSRVGAVPALLSPSLDGDVVTALLRRLDRPWLVTDHATLAGPLAQAPVSGVVRHTLTIGAAGDPTVVSTGVTALDTCTGGTAPAPARQDPRAPALITHSSGTTGLPKLVVHCANTMWHRLLPQKLMGWPTRGEPAAACMSYAHSRFYHALGVFLHYGSPLLMLVDPDPASVGPLLARVRPGIVETHPNTFVLWEGLADAPGQPLSSVRCYGSTFDAIHPRTIQRLLAASHRRSPWLLQLYGQSETGPIAARWFTRRGAAKQNGRLIGTALPGFTRVRVVDEAGRRCPAGTAGHIEARTRGRLLTYLGAENEYAQQVDGAWWRMGDVGRINRWGALYLIDREIDQIESVDSNLAIEDQLMSRLEELREIVIVPDPAGQPVPVVCTTGDRALDPDRWARATADLSAMAAPVVCRFDDLPRTGTWKIKRVDIARLLADSRALRHNWNAS